MFLFFVFFSGNNEDDDDGEDVMARTDQVDNSGMASSTKQPGKRPIKPRHYSKKRQKILANKPQDFQVLSEF